MDSDSRDQTKGNRGHGRPDISRANTRELRQQGQQILVRGPKPGHGRRPLPSKSGTHPDKGGTIQEQTHSPRNRTGQRCGCEGVEETLEETGGHKGCTIPYKRLQNRKEQLDPSLGGGKNKRERHPDKENDRKNEVRRPLPGNLDKMRTARMHLVHRRGRWRKTTTTRIGP